MAVEISGAKRLRKIGRAVRDDLLAPATSAYRDSYSAVSPILQQPRFAAYRGHREDTARTLRGHSGGTLWPPLPCSLLSARPPGPLSGHEWSGLTYRSVPETGDVDHSATRPPLESSPADDGGSPASDDSFRVRLTKED